MENKTNTATGKATLKEKSPYRFFYVRDANNKSICVATKKLDDYTIRYAFSIMSPKDHSFNGELARKIALGRLSVVPNSRSVVHKNRKNPQPMYGFYGGVVNIRPKLNRDIVAQIAQNKYVSKRVRDIAAWWLNTVAVLADHRESQENK